jgi:hypothetical protein
VVLGGRLGDPKDEPGAARVGAQRVALIAAELDHPEGVAAVDVGDVEEPAFGVVGGEGHREHSLLSALA